MRNNKGQFIKGSKPWHAGRINVYTENALKKMSDKKIGIKTRWKGGRIVDKDGYLLIYSPDHPYRNRHKYVREHRLVIENNIGRFLAPFEIVHHIDGNKKNNNVDNLLLLTQGEHASLHLKIRHAKNKKA